MKLAITAPAARDGDIVAVFNLIHHDNMIVDLADTSLRKVVLGQTYEPGSTDLISEW
jgi:hypothetical protein